MLKFNKLQEHHLEMVMEWRTKPEVTQYMFTDIEYNIRRQQEWYGRIVQDNSCRYWIIMLGEVSIGLISLTDLDWYNNRSSWAFYIGETNHRLIGGMIAPYLYNYAFDVLKLNKLTGEVMEGNENIRKIHKLHGCREIGVLKQHIYKYNRYHDVYLFEMVHCDWMRLKDKYRHCVADFED